MHRHPRQIISLALLRPPLLPLSRESELGATVRGDQATESPAIWTYTVYVLGRERRVVVSWNILANEGRQGIRVRLDGRWPVALRFYTSVHGLGLSVVRESRLGWKTMASASCLRLTNICLSPPNQNQMQLVSVQVDGGPKAMSWRVHLLRVVCSSAAGRRLDWIYHRPPGRTSPPKEQCLNSPTGG
ncbi:hypothetical protein L209DRAFT_119899 [Thermothelomyces heterothallicus CBS 203.75]